MMWLTSFPIAGFFKTGTEAGQLIESGHSSVLAYDSGTEVLLRPKRGSSSATKSTEKSCLKELLRSHRMMRRLASLLPKYLQRFQALQTLQA